MKEHLKEWIDATGISEVPQADYFWRLGNNRVF
jgi:hypothetical protein